MNLRIILLITFGLSIRIYSLNLGDRDFKEAIRAGPLNLAQMATVIPGHLQSLTDGCPFFSNWSNCCASLIKSQEVTIQLARSYSISTVVIYFQTGEEVQFVELLVKVGLIVCQEFHGNVTNYHPIELICTTVLNGDNINLLAIDNVAVCEIEVYSDNIALKAPLRAWRRLNEALSFNDGDLANGYPFLSIPHWFMFFLIRPYLIKEIKVFRTMNNLHADGKVFQLHPQYDRSNEKLCGSKISDTNNLLHMECQPNSEGAYVEFTVRKTHAFFQMVNLVEIEIYGERIDKEKYPVNVAFQKPISVSKPSSSCISALTDGSIFTAADAVVESGSTWMCIDMLAVYSVTYFILYKTSENDNSVEKIDFKVSKLPTNDPFSSLYELCYRHDSQTTGFQYNSKCLNPNPIGRYFLILQRKTVQNNIAISDIEVFGIFLQEWNSQLISHKIIQRNRMDFQKSHVPNVNLWKTSDHFPYNPINIVPQTCVEISTWFLIQFFNISSVHNFTIVPKCSQTELAFDNLELSVINSNSYDIDLNNYPNGIAKCLCWRSSDHESLKPGRLIYGNCMNTCYGQALFVHTKSSNKIKVCEIYVYGKSVDFIPIEHKPSYFIFNDSYHKCEQNKSFYSLGKPFTIWLESYAKVYGLTLNSKSANISISLNQTDSFEICSNYDFTDGTDTEIFSIFCKNFQVVQYIKIESNNIDICSIKASVKFVRLSNYFKPISSFGIFPFYKRDEKENVMECAQSCLSLPYCLSFGWNIKNKVCLHSKFLIPKKLTGPIDKSVIKFTREMNHIPNSNCI
ncbi:DgyrCDS4668 [Dimorphilus gyrociliatus]|uniref:DgyrCDS4668 n=1 Tax=Dimorphilus gyrociliatus TaxID=2664684 RepID=A0A7I8VJW4_9ANNE|nr:DgyrCDS4668 [Dimorphilus gyrociliatus]